MTQTDEMGLFLERLPASRHGRYLAWVWPRIAHVPPDEEIDYELVGQFTRRRVERQLRSLPT